MSYLMETKELPEWVKQQKNKIVNRSQQSKVSKNMKIIQGSYKKASTATSLYSEKGNLDQSKNYKIGISNVFLLTKNNKKKLFYF